MPSLDAELVALRIGHPDRVAVLAEHPAAEGGEPAYLVGDRPDDPQVEVLPVLGDLALPKAYATKNSRRTS